MQEVRSVMWTAIREQIDRRGPINYDNALLAAQGIVIWMEDHGYSIEKEERDEDIKVGGTDPTD